MAEAALWTRRAAEQGYAPAQFMLARLYSSGTGLQRDIVEGFTWVSRAVDNGHVDAMGMLGLIYHYGEGVPRDAQKARAWLERAVAAGSHAAPNWFGKFYLEGEAGSARRTNYVEALRWFERAASNGVVSAANTAADLCAKGKGTPPDSTRAVHWYRVAADQGSPDALEQLAAFYTRGLAEPRGEDDTPVLLLRRSAALRATAFGRAGAESWSIRPSWALIQDCQALWSQYHFGFGTPRDHVAAAEWMWVAHQEDRRRVAAGQRSFTGADKAEHPFGPVLQGKVTALSANERLWHHAVRLVNEALDEGKAEAWFKIGESYRDGSALTPRQPRMAWAWFARAAEMGHAAANPALKALEATLNVDELAKAKRFWVPPLNSNATGGR